MPCEGLLVCASDSIPQADGVVPTRAGDGPPDRAESDASNHGGMPREGLPVCAGDSIPQPDSIV